MDSLFEGQFWEGFRAAEIESIERQFEAMHAEVQAEIDFGQSMHELGLSII